MLPGFVAGHYGYHDCHIDLERLCGIAGIDFRQSEAIGIDPAAKQVRCGDGSMLDYDVLSIDIGSTPETQAVPGAADHVIRVKPVSGFIAHWNRVRDLAKSRNSPPRIALVGGGAGGVELALAMRYRLHKENMASKFYLLTDTAMILPYYPEKVRRIFERILGDRDIEIQTRSKITKIGRGVLYREAGAPLQAEHIIWATTAGSPRWLAAGGIKTDARGFIVINDQLQSVSHPCVFAAGDIASMTSHIRPKSGVYAVRQGPPLAENLRRALSGTPFISHIPRKTALALISAGNKYAVAVYDGIHFQGKWVWRWKDRIDRKFVARYNMLSLPPRRPFA